jgi:uncharacterized integral membrane protein
MRLKMTYIKSIILIIVLLFLITFGVKNNQATALNYYFNITGMIPLYGIVYISIIIGIIIGMIVGISSRITLGKKVKYLQREARELREKLEESMGEEEEVKEERED